MAFDNFKPTINTDNLNAAAKNLGLSVSLKSVITNAAKAYVEADVNVLPNSNTYTLMQQKDAFARVNVGSNEGGGYALILKKVYDIWVVVAAGQDLPNKATGEKYGLPTGWYSTDC